jgi:hypothetical protein
MSFHNQQRGTAADPTVSAPARHASGIDLASTEAVVRLGQCLRECPENGCMTTREARSVGSTADRGNGDAMGVAVDYDGG